ncbi:MAG: hypothetical protein IJP64_04255 [Oscillospiraceae bacterium]|nr:hypothetical protein [Oscillospiraceae bacterium]
MTAIKVCICVLFALLLLAGCGPQNRDAAPNPTEEIIEPASLESEEIDEMIAEQIEESGEVLPEEQTGGDEEKAAALAALLEDVRTSVFPGTAGNSLRAAGRAAAMADFFAEGGMSPDEADRAVQDYIASLSAEDAELFEMQLDAVLGAFSSLTGENGADLLEDCGYESAYFPWSEENVRNCFAALPGSD